MNQHMKIFLFALLLAASTVIAQAAPDLESGMGQAGDVPKGEIIPCSLLPGNIFPGAAHDYWIYVPRQYDPAVPACVYVNQDGIQFDAPKVFDQLIAAKEMPVTIGIFVAPGKTAPVRPGTPPCYSRSLEYDGLGDAYARFLLEELLPDAQRKTASGNRPIRLSSKGSDRCIGGASSGGICAFTAAWERPEEFSRVYSAVGTFVALRGGNNYPWMIRKCEPKPIRIFLQDGTRDQNIYCGDWWTANQDMDRALVFAGYEASHAWGEEGHASGGHAARVFPDAMRFLWKDWPAMPKAGNSRNAFLSGLASPDETWKPSEEKLPPPDTVLLADGSRYVVQSAPDGSGKIRFVGADGKQSIVDPTASAPSVLALSPDHSLLFAADNRSHRVYSYQIRPDGTLTAKQPRFFFHVPANEDGCAISGIAVDRAGRLYAATSMGVQVCDGAGRVNCILATPPGRTGSLGFGGDKLSSLIIECNGKSFGRKLKVTGTRSDNPPSSSPPPCI